MKIFGDLQSGNCLKVKWTADKLGISYDWLHVDIMAGASRTRDFLEMNPMGQVPTVQLADGRVIAQSNAIMCFLASGTELLPEDRYERAKVDELLFWEQYSHEPYIAVCRFHMLYEGKSAESRDPQRVTRGEQALDLMDNMLATREWLSGNAVTVADISLLAYTRVAHEGGFDLSTRPNVLAWIDRCEKALELNSDPNPGS